MSGRRDPSAINCCELGGYSEHCVMANNLICVRITIKIGYIAFIRNGTLSLYPNSKFGFHGWRYRSMVCWRQISHGTEAGQFDINSPQPPILSHTLFSLPPSPTFSHLHMHFDPTTVLSVDNTAETSPRERP